MREMDKAVLENAYAMVKRVARDIIDCKVLVDIDLIEKYLKDHDIKLDKYERRMLDTTITKMLIFGIVHK